MNWMGKNTGNVLCTLSLLWFFQCMVSIELMLLLFFFLLFLLVSLNLNVISTNIFLLFFLNYLHRFWYECCLVRPANAMWVCIDFKIARWKFDIDSKWSNFFLQENQPYIRAYIDIQRHIHMHMWSQSNSLTHSFSLAVALSHTLSFT